MTTDPILELPATCPDCGCAPLPCSDSEDMKALRDADGVPYLRDAAGAVHRNHPVESECPVMAWRSAPWIIATGQPPYLVDYC